MKELLQIDKDLKSQTLLGHLSVGESLPYFDLTHGRPLIVLGESGELIGTLSSGDIRRAHSRFPDLLSQPVSQICNRHAQYAHINDTHTTIEGF